MMREEPYKVGERAVLINCYNEQYNNTDCVITGGLTLRKLRFPDKTVKHSMAYLVVTHDDLSVSAQPWQLKPRIRQPEKELAEDVRA